MSGPTTRSSSKRATSTTTHSEESCVIEKHGFYKGEHALWKGCVCGIIHPPPEPVVWIACDGPCQDWYNVAPACVGWSSITDHDDDDEPWVCPTCSSGSVLLQLLLTVPDPLLYRVVQYTAAPMERARVISFQLASLSKSVYYSLHVKRQGLWSLLLNNDYPSSSSPRRKRRCRLATNKSLHYETRSFHLLQQVQDIHTRICQRTDDAHVALSTLAESSSTPLTVQRLRSLLGPSSSSSSSTTIMINRRSPYTGRTFLHTVCAADYIAEDGLLRCVRELVEHYGANVQVATRHEPPYAADRPVLYFAIARVMPSVVAYILQQQQQQQQNTSRYCQDVERASGRWRLVSDPTKSFVGSFSPLEFALALQREEESCGSLSSYWCKKLQKCIELLASSSSSKPGTQVCSRVKIISG